ncbi:hypothetical protein CEUSTIGMA_g414.t1 [Chlamydomonas eustigma]|uniref:Sas10 C-terminal domain-containing protein n=1 Tax=Chlamydomonas eustigma TaxID=1157962 RepID=A0A250WQJ1_9CHLO|nr:hypothetical protein CEUSTIGMA_g414.t1 [Chlamydomonas eustigma]|eukprot:GAX72959.1 hypothetical protein CEUSTIGMA_g414.t1 [Chlamydomonas eustigma]
MRRSVSETGTVSFGVEAWNADKTILVLQVLDKMGRSKSKSWSSAQKVDAPVRRKGRAATVADDFALSESDNDFDDDFESKRGTISLERRKKNSVDSDNDMEEEEVMALAGEGSDSDEDEFNDEEEGGEEEEDDDDLSDLDEDTLINRALEKGGRTAELARQAKMIGAKLKLQCKEDEDEEDEEENEVGDERWGANKKRYYDADTAGMEGSDDEEALKEEEEEVMRLEKERATRMKDSDFGLEEEEEEEDGEGTMAALAKKDLSVGKPKKGGLKKVVVETVSKQLDLLSTEERNAALLSDAPELLALLQDLTDSLAEVRGRVGPVLSEVKSGGLATAEGVSYLEAKHLLLLQYCTHIVFYILLKAEGRPVKDHPVIARLVELRAYMEKIRPIDKRLQYQVERLIKAAQIASQQEAQLRHVGVKESAKAGKKAEKGSEMDAGLVPDEEDEGDASRYGPRRDQLVPKIKVNSGEKSLGPGEDLEGGRTGLYRPPRINPVSMEGDIDKAELTRNESRLMKEARRKASRSALVRELAEEVTGAPRELRHEMPGFDSLASIKQRQRLEARAAVEEDMMIRVPLSREEAKKMKQQHRAGMSGKALMDDFADEVADIVGLSESNEGKKGSQLAELFNRQKVSQKYGADAPRGALHGGDEDLPRREALHERRIKFDAAAARKMASGKGKMGDEDEDDGMPDSEFFGGGGGKRNGKRPFGEEDDTYQEAKASAAERKLARSKVYAPSDAHAPLPEPEAEGARGITSAIERNRGLTPHRRKDLKNPRKKHRIKFQEAQMRRKGAVQDVRQPAGTSYGGEATGVKSRVVKSRKLG